MSATPTPNLDKQTPAEIRLADYQPTAFATDQTRLDFDLLDGHTLVNCEQSLQRRPAAADAPLILQGVDLELVELRIDGRVLSGNEYRLEDETLTITDVPDQFVLRVETKIFPEKNTALEGLYKSGGMYCTQCEAEGFRKITYFQDRPDVLSIYTTSITADAQTYPVMLANGNLVADQTVAGRRTVTWHDPHPKPSYLFAMVAGNLSLLEDSFTTASGRVVKLQIFSEPHNIDQCDYAMGALKRAMRWDEEVYGREYDLDIFMVVAVDDFNMGAMENKGLNIFNTSCVLATPDTATDLTYQRIEGIVAHEYFHNWSGNRVTCRDWFQLSLKEGFTVFRDAEFSADMNSRTVKRIEDVSHLRAVQFAEDSGPLAHSVRPASYFEISNFYTPTIYDKGAEVVRMLHTCLGADQFRAGSDLYFARHDGAAVTTEDFLVCMEEASDNRFDAFRRWYEQAGTPVLTVADNWNEQTKTYHLTFRQHTPDTPGQTHKNATHIPVVLGLLDQQGQELVLTQEVVQSDMTFEIRDRSLVVHLQSTSGALQVTGLTAAPVPSLLRGFSAPVRVEWESSPPSLSFLAQHDADGFARWDALQTLLVEHLTAEPVGGEAGLVGDLQSLIGELLQQALSSSPDAESLGLAAEMLSLPTVSYLFEQVDQIDPLGLVSARNRLKTELAQTFAEQWLQLYQANRSTGVYAPDADAIAQRRLQNLALSFLCAAPNPDAQLLLDHLSQADNFTDRKAALGEIANAEFLRPGQRESLLADFYERWQDQGLIVNQWLSLQSTSRFTGVEGIRQLEQHPSYDQRNPNKMRSLLGGFSQGNFENFHATDGKGYAYLAEKLLELNQSNPQMASRISGPLTGWRRFTQPHQRLMRAALVTLSEAPDLSKDLFEVVTKALDES